MLVASRKSLLKRETFARVSEEVNAPFPLSYFLHRVPANSREERKVKNSEKPPPSPPAPSQCRGTVSGFRTEGNNIKGFPSPVVMRVYGLAATCSNCCRTAFSNEVSPKPLHVDKVTPTRAQIRCWPERKARMFRMADKRNEK